MHPRLIGFASFLLGIVLSFSTVACAQSQSQHTRHPTLIDQVGCPVKLNQFQSGANELFRSGYVTNRSDRVVTAMKIGWLVFGRRGGVTSAIGKEVEFDPSLQPQRWQKIGAQHIPKTLVDTALALGFFVAEVQYADGSKWTADVAALKSEFQASPEQPEIVQTGRAGGLAKKLEELMVPRSSQKAQKKA